MSTATVTQDGCTVGWRFLDDYQSGFDSHHSGFDDHQRGSDVHHCGPEHKVCALRPLVPALETGEGRSGQKTSFLCKLQINLLVNGMQKNRPIYSLSISID